MSAASRRRDPRPHARVLASAARALTAVTAHGRSADDALAPFREAADRPAIRAITLGGLRWYWRLWRALEPLLGERQPLAAPLRSLLIAAAHQIEYSRSIPQSVVQAAVDAARVLGEARASGLVNAVLRRFVAERAELLSRLESDLAAATAHPAWLVSEIERAWTAETSAILAGNNRHPPFVLRVDLSRVSVAEYLGELAVAGLEARALGSWAPAAIEIARPVPVQRLPGFPQGRASVQDAGAQLAAPLLGARQGMRALDACAAPGGKTLHLLEHTPGLAELVAVDIDAGRLRLVEENLRRAGREARLIAADVRDLGAMAPFDRILVDAPCSSTGVIRRHPDIKLLRRSSDIESYAAAQREILTAAFRLLAPGGRLLYCTCSVLPAENDDLLTSFIATEPLVRPVAMPPAADLAPGARDRPLGVQLLPGAEAGTDGFYYACLEKTTAGN